jgi:hypothetical protein
MPLHIRQTEAGAWAVVDASGLTVSEHATNGQAWKAIDRLTLEAEKPRDLAKDFVKAVEIHETKQKWFSALLKLAHDKGRGRGWAAHRFREKFGHWPDDLSDDFAPMFPAVAMFLRDRRK